MKTEKETDAFIDVICDFFNELEEEEASLMAHSVINIALDFGTKNHYESLGMLTTIVFDRQKELDDEVKKELKKKKKNK